MPHPVWREAVGDQIRDVRREAACIPPLVVVRSAWGDFLEVEGDFWGDFCDRVEWWDFFFFAVLCMVSLDCPCARGCV